MAPSKDTVPVQYSVVIRLPFRRGSFQDPPQVQWDASKDKKLWKLIARNPKSAGVVGGNGEMDWPAIAADFGVDTPFLLQQAAWLYERHFKHVKAQMTRIRASSNAASPSPGPGHGQSTTAFGKRPSGMCC
jgi:Atg29 N-terminal domain